MGLSAEGILFYGVHLRNEDEEGYFEAMGRDSLDDHPALATWNAWTGHYLQKKGLGRYEDGNNRTLVDALPVEVDRRDYEAIILIKKSVRRFDLMDGYELPFLRVEPEWDAQFAQFLEDLDLPPIQPKWRIAVDD